MSSPFLGEVRMFAFSFAPKGWALCDGQTIPISQNNALFALLGTFYGGDGATTFALPNLQSRLPLSFSNQFSLGSTGGVESHALTTTEMPPHNHIVAVSSATSNSAAPTSPVGNYWAKENNGDAPYAPSGGAVALHPSAVSLVGGGIPHTNLQPSLTTNFCIALQGIFPSRN